MKNQETSFHIDHAHVHVSLFSSGAKYKNCVFLALMVFLNLVWGDEPERLG